MKLDHVPCLTLLAVAGLAIHALGASGETSRGELLLRIDQVVDASMKRDRVPGVSIAVEHNAMGSSSWPGDTA